MSRIFAMVAVVCLVFANVPKADAWAPTGWLANIPLYYNCYQTGGDIGIAQPGVGIYWCPDVAAEIDLYNPGASAFYLAHEYGHFATSPWGGEAEADCWAAQQLAAWGDHWVLQAAIAHFNARGYEYLPGYGTGFDRANRIQSCSAIAYY